MPSPSRIRFATAALFLALTLAACGLGRDQSGDNGAVNNPVVAATVNGRPIYVEDVRAHAVARGLLQEGQDLDHNSDSFYFALEEMIQVRLFALEAEARGLDRRADVRRQLENAREAVLARAIYDEIDERATNPQAIERLYRENVRHLGGGEQIHLRHIRFDTREAADAAKRRLDHGERFEALAFELSTDRESAADGGDLPWANVSDLSASFRQAVEHADTGTVVGPVQANDKWELIRVEDRRQEGAPSLEELRPRIITWLRFQEITQLQERLLRDARVERLREQQNTPSAGAPTAPAETPAPPPAVATTAPDMAAPPGQSPPPFPFPMGPGGVTGGAPASGAVATTTTAPITAPPQQGGGATP